MKKKNIQYILIVFITVCVLVVGFSIKKIASNKSPKEQDPAAIHNEVVTQDEILQAESTDNPEQIDITEQHQPESEPTVEPEMISAEETSTELEPEIDNTKISTSYQITKEELRSIEEHKKMVAEYKMPKADPLTEDEQLLYEELCKPWKEKYPLTRYLWFKVDWHDGKGPQLCICPSPTVMFGGWANTSFCPFPIVIVDDFTYLNEARDRRLLCVRDIETYSIEQGDLFDSEPWTAPESISDKS